MRAPLTIAIVVMSMVGTERADAAPPDAEKNEREWGGLYNGRSLGSGGGGVIVEGGWPGFTAGALFGVLSFMDLGAKISPQYHASYEIPRNNQPVQPRFGLDLRLVSRFQVVDTELLGLLLRVEPGFRFDHFSPDVQWAVEPTIGADLGIRVMPGGSVYVGLDMPMAFTVKPIASQQILILPGAGFEYHVTQSIGVGARFNAGPSLFTASGFPVSAAFAFNTTGFFIFRWDRIAR
jgi:hypothetical protein